MRQKKFMIAKPGEKNDENYFAKQLRKKLPPPEGVGVVAFFSEKIGLQKNIISRAFQGKSITTAVASKMAHELGFEATEIFVEIDLSLVPQKERRRPSKLRQYIMPKNP